MNKRRYIYSTRERKTEGGRGIKPSMVIMTSNLAFWY